MRLSTSPASLEPVISADRSTELDAMRGVALFGVLMVNLLTGFRVSLFQHILTPHTHPGWLNLWVDNLTAWLLQFKAMVLFSFLFGVGLGIQAERAALHGANTSRFLVWRFATLLFIGLCHMFLVWNGDILTLYAVCGLLLIPFHRLTHKQLAVLGIALIALAPYLSFVEFPTQQTMRAHAVVAKDVYAEGDFSEIMALRAREALHFILPLLLGSMVRTFGLMLLGIATWRSGFLRQREARRKELVIVLVAAGGLGAVLTTLVLWSSEVGTATPAALDWLYPHAAVLLASGYGAGLLLWLRSTQEGVLQRLLAAVGRMALTNYLGQSFIFSFLFYGFGFGWFGKLGPAVTALVGLVVFAVQLVASDWWLRHFRFGPGEWLWRSVAYRQWQPFRVRYSERPTSHRVNP